MRYEVAIQLTLALIGFVLIPYLAWIGIQIIRLGRDLVRLRAEMEVRIKSINAILDQRLVWLRGIEGKIDSVEGKVDCAIGKLDILCRRMIDGG